MRELVVFLSVVLLHELGHLGSACLMGVPVRSFGGKKWGLQLIFSMNNISYVRELVVLLSGSLVGLLSIPIIHAPAYTPPALVLNCLNLLPIEGLDGGGVLSCFLHLVLPGDVADRLHHTICHCTAVLFWSGGLWIALRAHGNVAWLLLGMGMVLGRQEDQNSR